MVRAGRSQPTSQEEVVAPVVQPTLPPFLQSVQARLDKDCEGNPSSYAVVPLQSTTPRGLFINKVTFARYIANDNLVRWRISADKNDLVRGRDVLSVVGKSLAEAWQQYTARVEQLGQCGECGCITYADEGEGCGACQLRAVTIAPTECTICKLAKTNIYQLLCAHKMCRQCALRCKSHGTVRECPFRCARRFRINQGLREEEVGCSCEDDEDD